MTLYELKMKLKAKFFNKEFHYDIWYQFPRAAVTKYQELVNLEQEKLGASLFLLA